MQILVDADACPVKEIIVRLARERRIEQIIDLVLKIKHAGSTSLGLS
jgi:uncharacterized protein YaiI (UPF0178 family)